MKGKKTKGNFLSSEVKNSPWHDAIQKVKERLEQHKRDGQKLRAALRAFEENLATGKPWPGEQQKSPQREGAVRAF